MTEAEWLASTAPVLMIVAIKDGATERKLRLLALSCCWRNEYLLVTDDAERRRMPSEVNRRRRAIAVLESRIEGTSDEGALRRALLDASGGGYGAVRDPGDTVGCAVFAASSTFHCIFGCHWEGVVTATGQVPAYDALTQSTNPDLEQIVALWRVPQSGRHEGHWMSDEQAVRELPEFVSALRIEQSNQVQLLRDIFGNPFRPVAFASEWRTDTVLALAAQMYESRNFSAMPILADALQDAGCDHPDILNHCRETNAAHVRGCWVVDLVLGKA